MTETNGQRSQSLASDIVSNFQEYEASGFQKKMERRCIYKCPYGLITIKNLKGKHIPHMVSFGPYHYGAGHLQAMEFHKRRALHGIVIGARLPPSPAEAQEQLRLRLHPFMDALSEVEEELRDCYDQLGPDWSPSKPFLEMMLLDGCFMLELLRCTMTPDNYNFGSRGAPPDPIFGPNVSPYMRAVLRRDMLMLENQIPLLVLERILHVKNRNRGCSCTTCNYTYLNRLIIDFFGFKFSEKPDLGFRRGLHVLDVYRECLIGSPRQVPNQNPNPSPRRSCDATSAGAPNGSTPVGDGRAEKKASHNQAGDQLDQNSGTILACLAACANTIEMGSRCQVRTGQLPDQNPRTLYQDSIVVDCSQSEENNGSQVGGNQPDQNCCSLSRNNMVPHAKSTGVPSVKWLRDAGVTFKKSHGGRFSDVHFDDKNGVLSLPFLEIDEDTAAKFMNLIAFERMHPSIGGQVTSYFLFMDALLDTGEDVRLLISRGIVRNELGSDDAAAKLFNSLGDGVVDNDVQNDGVSQLDADKSVRWRTTEVLRKLNAYASSKRNMWIADLKHKYFNSPWACISLFAAILLIVLTVLQTTYGALAFYKG
ncbi:hypothetical protein EJ110_NYTH46890 [Nymphaea thermarum]|nr:hypothetical protein EJ110_NYTH46890 [Nymphaea thermarum]